MSVVWLSWYICGVCLLLALLASAISWHPNVQYLALVVPSVFGSLGLLAAGIAAGLGRLPPSHRIRQSKPLWVILVAFASIITLFLILVG